jgi:hypothetical protein
MTQKATTKDELFLIKLYQFASDAGDPESEIDRYRIGKAIGQNNHAIDTIIKHLAQANFVIKSEGNLLYLTPHGLNLARSLHEERQN